MNFIGRECVIYTYLTNTDEGPFNNSMTAGLDVVECTHLALDDSVKVGDTEYISYIELDYS